MDCSGIKEYLYLFIDNELDSQRTQLVKEHIYSCPLCSLELEQEKKIDSLIRTSTSKSREKAPYELKEAILNRIRTFEEKGVRRFALHILRPALIGISGVLLIIILLSSLNEPFPVFSESVKDHIRFLQGNLSMDIVSSKPGEVRDWLQTKLDFRVMCPDLSSQGVNLLGARICILKNRRAAYIVYEKNKRNVSVFMFDAKDLRFPKAKKVHVNNKIFYLCKEKGYTSALWIDEGIACVFVSDLGETEVLYLASL